MALSLLSFGSSWINPKILFEYRQPTMKRNDELQHDRPLYWASPAAEILASIAAAMSHSYHFLTRRRRRLVIPLLLVFIFAATHIQAGKRGFTVGSGRDQAGHDALIYDAHH